MRIMKRYTIVLSAIIAVGLCPAMLSSCSKYNEMPFGGMNGKVQKVTVTHIMPEVWHANNRGSDIMYINTSVYDVEGNEIYSAVQDSAYRFVSQAESLFDNGVCIRSTQKAGNRVVAQINLMSKKRGTFEYNKEINGRLVRMTVKESSFGRRYKSVVTEDGKVTTISVIQTDRKGFPVKITISEPLSGKKTVETNVFDENYNVVEKHVYTNMGETGKEEDNTTYFKYGDLDEHGNWTVCRTYNKIHLPAEILVREIDYWE